MKSKKIVLSENDVSNSILEFLHFKGIPGVRMNNGAVYDPVNKKFRAKHKWEKQSGTPLDIFVFLPDGVNCWIEVKKNEKEKMTPGQVQWADNVTKNKGIAFKAFSLACVKEALGRYLK